MHCMHMFKYFSDKCFKPGNGAERFSTRYGCFLVFDVGHFNGHSSFTLVCKFYSVMQECCSDSGWKTVLQFPHHEAFQYNVTVTCFGIVSYSQSWTLSLLAGKSSTKSTEPIKDYLGTSSASCKMNGPCLHVETVSCKPLIMLLSNLFS